MLHTKLLLIRHGHIVDNEGSREPRMIGATDVPLSQRGRQEVALLTRFLGASQARFESIYTSPLQRAHDTARALSAAGLGPLRVVDSLREIDCGACEGLPIARVERELPERWQAHLRQDDEDFAWPGGETYRAFRARCVDAVSAIASRHAGARVAVVTHAGVITQIMGAITGCCAARWDAFRAGNGSLTEISWCSGRGTVLRFNERSHL